MCGRYRLTNAECYSDLNNVRVGGNPFPPRFNIAPTQTVFVVLDESPKEFSAFKWGLVPSWAKERKSKMEAYPIAARVDSPKNDDAGIIARLRL